MLRIGHCRHGLSLVNAADHCIDKYDGANPVGIGLVPRGGSHDDSGEGVKISTLLNGVRKPRLVATTRAGRLLRRVGQ